MRGKLKVITSIFVMVVLMQIMFVLPAFAETTITTDTAQSVKNNKLVIKVSDETIKIDEVEAIFITVGDKSEKNNAFTDNILKVEPTGKQKVIVANDIFYRIYDGYINIEIWHANNIARRIGTSKKDIKVEVVLTKGRKLTGEGSITGIFEASSDTPSTDPDDKGKYLFLDYKYTHNDTKNGGHWAYEQVKKLNSIGIVKGTTEGYLFPDSRIVLEEFIAMLSRALKYMNKASNTSSTNVYNYSTVESGYDPWVKDEYAILMNAFAIISEETTNKGKTELTKIQTIDETLKSTVTREEAAIMMAAFLGDCSNIENPNNFTDWDKVNNKGRIARLCEFGIMYGTPNSNGTSYTIEPTREISRVEALVMIAKFMEMKNDILVKPQSETIEKPIVSDATAPDIIFTPNGGNIQSGSQVLFNVTDSESKITTIRYSWDNAVSTSIYSINSKTYSKILDVPVEAGEHTLRVWARNEGGKATGWKVVTYTVGSVAGNIDTTPPIVKFSIGSKEVGIFTTIDQNAKTGVITAEDPESGIKQIVYHWNNDNDIVINANNVTVNLPQNANVAHYLYVRAQNGAGLWSEYKYEYKPWGATSNTDTTSPEVSINTTLIQISTKDHIQITAKDNESGVSQIIYRWDSNQEIVNNCSGAFDITIVANVPQVVGEHKLYVRAVNGVGLSSQEQVYIFNVKSSNKPLIPGNEYDPGNDKTLPEVTLNTNSEKISLKDTLKLTAKDEESCVTQIVYRWDSNQDVVMSCNALSMTIEIPLPQTLGVHWLYVKALNGAGLWSAEQPYRFEIVDSKTPIIEEEIDSEIIVIIDGDEDDATPNNGDTLANVVEKGTVITITGEDRDEIEAIGYRWDNEKEKIIENAEIEITVPDSIGVHYLFVRIKYEDEGWTDVRKYKFVVVKDINKVDLEKVTVVVKDAKNGTIEYSKEYDWDDVEDDGQIIIKAPKKEGKYILTARVLDEDNNIYEVKRYEFEVEEDDDSNLVGKTKLDRTGIAIKITRDGKDAEDAGMVTYPGNPELIGSINPNVNSLRVEIRNAEDKLMFEPEQDIKYYVDFYNGSDAEIDDVSIILYIQNGFEGVSASDEGKIEKDKITWEIGKLVKGGGNRYTAVIKYVGQLAEDFQFTPEVDILVEDNVVDTSFVYNLMYKPGVSGAGYHNGYVVGYPDGTFNPQGTITRAEMAAMFSKLFGLEAYSGSAFSDLQSDHWANSAINGCVYAELIDVYGDYFDPNSPATRAMFATGLARFLGVAEIEPIFINSTDTEGHSAMKPMEQLIRLGLIDGYSDGSSGINNLVTRAEAVTMLNKYAFRGGLTLSTSNSYGNNYVFTDLRSGHWAINQILEAALDHNYTRTSNGEEEAY